MIRSNLNESQVLILGDHQRHQIEGILQRMNYAPLVRGSVQHCLELLRTRFLFAVFIDREFNQADVLEFVLNVRDLDCDVPVVVIGRSKDPELDSKIEQQGNVIIVDRIEEIESSFHDMRPMFGAIPV